MQLSIIIVNYNVKHFLEQCLLSVINATKRIEAEIIVVDNNSVDGSCHYIRKRFPTIELIENNENKGFSKANNQGIARAKGNFVLLLNPDTVVQEDTFDKCLSFMEAHPKAGAMTVKMIDGKGRFLPESKRALPSPAVAFYKIFGLSKLFPHSKRFARYHLGHLDKHKVQRIEILPGAFMFMRHSALQEVGALDERFFMYGEDIDLSYRFLKKGYTNYYCPDTQIIHYKGESTKKGSINYVRVFYKAMILFAKKHFPSKHAKVFSSLIHVAIYIRAFVALLHRLFQRAFLPILDAGVFYIGLKKAALSWEKYRYAAGYFPEDKLPLFLAGFTILFLLSSIIAHNYQLRIRHARILRSIFVFALLSLSIYALLPEEWRISRVVALGATGIAFISAYFTRGLSHFVPGLPSFAKHGANRVAIITNSSAEVDRIKEVLKSQPEDMWVVGRIGAKNKGADEQLLGTLAQLEEIVRVNKLHELIFSAQDITSQCIISTMLTHTHVPINYKIAPPGTMSIIGSNSSNSTGELYHIHTNSIGLRENRIKKRAFDLFTSGTIVLFLPVLLIPAKKRKALVNNSIGVLLGCKTWVSYCKPDCNEHQGLPSLKEGIFPPLTVSTKRNKLSTTTNTNLLYAKNYKIKYDFNILLRGLGCYFR